MLYSSKFNSLSKTIILKLKDCRLISIINNSLYLLCTSTRLLSDNKTKHYSSTKTATPLVL